MKLTEMAIRQAKGIGKVQKLYDGGGLYLYITADGKKSWRMAYRFLGKQNTLTFGAYPSVSLREAREKREDAKRQLRENIDPNAAKQAAKIKAQQSLSNTFEAVAMEWHEKTLMHTSQENKHVTRQQLRDYVISVIGKRPIDAISAPELLNVFRKIEASGKLIIAHKCKNLCSRIFTYAIVTGRAERNPANDLNGALSPRNPVKHRATMQDKDKIGKLMYDLDLYKGSPQVCAGIRLAPLLFVRSRELTRAEWAHIDFDNAEWRIPAENMKMRQFHIVPLSKQAIAILQDIKYYTGRGRFVLPNMFNTHKEERPICHKTLLFALRHLGYGSDDMCIHGFRSMASTILNEHGFNRDWIERQLAHSERNGVRASYNYAQYLPNRHEMMQWYSDYLYNLKDIARKKVNGEIYDERKRFYYPQTVTA